MTKKYNEYGCLLIDDQLLILLDEVKDTFETKSGIKIYKADNLDGTKSKMEQAGQRRGTIVAMSEEAFLDLPQKWKPNVGERVYIDRHAGTEYEAPDGVWYRLISEAEIRAFINF